MASVIVLGKPENAISQKLSIRISLTIEFVWTSQMRKVPGVGMDCFHPCLILGTGESLYGKIWPNMSPYLW